MFPTSIPIQGVEWSVEIVKDLTDELGRLVYGLCDHDKKILNILQGEKKTMTHTLWHEIYHALQYQSGIWQSPSHDFNIEEIQAEQFANFMISWAVKFPRTKEVIKSKVGEL